MDLDSLAIDRRRGSTAATPQPSRLTAEDRRRLRDTNACYYCRQPGHILADCPLRPKTRPQQGNGKGTHPKAR